MEKRFSVLLCTAVLISAMNTLPAISEDKDFTGTYNTSGEEIISQGETWNINGCLNNESGNIINNGSIIASTIVNNSTIEGEGALTLKSGTAASHESIKQGTIEFGQLRFINQANLEATTKLTNKGVLDNSSSIVAAEIDNQASITGTGTLTASGSNSGTIQQSTVTLNGDLTNTRTVDAATLTTGSNKLTNNSGATVKITSSASGTIEGTGTTEIKGSSSANITQNTVKTTGALTNTGSITTNTLNVSTGKLTNNNNLKVTSSTTGNVDGTGSMEIAGTNSANISQNSVTVIGDLTNTGSIEGKNTFTNSHTVDNNGSIIAGAIDNAATATIQGTGNITIKGGTNAGSIIQNAVKIENGLLNNGILTANGTFTNTGTINGTGSLNINAGGTSSADIEQSNVSVSGEFSNNAALVATGNFTNSGKITGSGDLTVGGGSNSGSIKQSSVTLTGVFTNNDTIETGTLKATAATLTNDGTLKVTTETNGTIGGVGSMEIAGTNNANINQSSVTVTGDLDNQGSIIAATILNNTSVTLDNNGTLGDSSSNITNKGTLNNNAGASIIANLIDNQSDFVNNSSVTTNTIKNTASITGDNGSLVIKNGGSNSETIVQNDITIEGGTLNNTGSITSKNNFENDGTITGNNGNLTIKDGSSSGSITQNNVTISGSFDNDARLETKGTLANSGTITNTSEIVAAAINNTADIKGAGNITIGGGENGGTIEQTDVTINGALTNDGTIASSGEFTNSAVITGEGTLNINNGSSTNRITQDNVNISGTFVNKAELNVAESLKNEGIIQNSSVITAVINNTADSVIEGTTGSNSTINIISGTNAGSITQSVVNITGGDDKSGILDNIGIIIANTFTNDATITGNGDLVVTNGTNCGSITQTTLENKGTFTTTGENAQATLTNVDNKGAKYIVDNKATTTISGTIDNTAKGTITINNGSEATIGNIVSAADSIINIDNGSTLTVETQENNLIGTINSNGGENTLGVSGADITSNINIGNNTKAILSIVDGVVHADAVIKISNNSELNVAGSKVTLNQNDSWTGQNKVTLDSGALTINNVTNNGLLVATGGELTLEAGALNVTKGSSIAADVTTDLQNGTTLNIQNKGQVTLNEGDKWSGKIVLGAKGTEAEIKYPTPGEDGQLPLPFDTATIRDNKDITLLDVSGLEKTGTLQANNGVLLLGDRDLDITGESYIAKEVAMQISGNINVNNGGSVAIDDNDILQTASGKNPQVTLSDGGTLNYGKTVDSGLDIVADGGNLNLLANSNLTFKQGKIEDAVVINIQKDANLTLDASTLNLDNKDTWNGNIINKGGIINANGLEKSSTSATLTQATGDLNLYNDSNLILGTESSITGGNITITKGENGTQGSVLTIYGDSEKDVVVSGYDEQNPNSEKLTMTIDEYSKFVLGKGKFVIDELSVSAIEKDGAIQAGLVDVMNGEISESTIGQVVINNTGDDKISQANFNIDVYARSNKKKDNDTFRIEKIGDNATVYINEWGLGGDLYGWDAPIDRHIKLNDIFLNKDGEALKNNIEVTDQQTFTPIGWYQLNKNDKTQIVTDENGVPVIDPLTGKVKREVIGSYYTLDLARYNPQVFRGQVATVAQWMNQLNIDDMLFTHSMVLPSFKDPEGGTMANRYAAESPLFAPYQYSRKDGGLWYKMYGTFENLQMNNGLSRVGNNAYGALIGADFGLKDLKNGWKFMPTAYVGYNGAHQTFAHMGQYQNGGQAGFLGTWYKDNIILGALAYGGIYDNSMDVHGFNDSTFNYFAGAATKASYNIRLHRDWVLQPNLFVAYNYFGQQNWHSRFGQMGMMAGQLNGVNIAPGLNLIWEKETFSAYATLQYMYNINGACGGRAGNVGLPKMEMDRGYIQYGLGINKKFTNRASGYLQAVLRNVGRTGVGFQAGFNYMIGK